ncbi:MAG: YARHG domain-containing protein [Alphaproteobacteria bacterium]
MLRFGRLGAFAGMVLLSAAAHADESCSLAGNGICEEIYLGAGYCAPATDSADCAGAEVLPFSDDRPLTNQDVRYMAGYQLRLARNEIFARHGYRFNSEDLQRFFGARSWYAPVGQNVTLTPVEQTNVEFLRVIEDGGALNRNAQRSEPPNGSTLPPWTGWIADMVHADGHVDAAIVNGIRGRVYDNETQSTVMVRPDVGDMLFWGDEPEFGASTPCCLFPPIVLEPYVLDLGIVPQPLGRETLLGETVTRVRLDWDDGEGFASLHGEAWLTDDGIFLQVKLQGVFTECCGGDEGIPWTLDYHLENLQRGPNDPSLMEPPPFQQWSYAG